MRRTASLLCDHHDEVGLPMSPSWLTHASAHRNLIDISSQLTPVLDEERAALQKLYRYLGIPPQAMLSMMIMTVTETELTVQTRVP